MDRINKMKVRLYGAGGHAHVIVDALKSNDFEVSEIFDDEPKNGLIASLKVEKIAANYENFQFKGSPMIIAIGNNKIRKKIANLLEVEYITVTHKKSAVATNTSIGNGTVIFAGAIIQPNTKIGNHVIINSGASVDHDNIIEDFVHISPQVTLCGEVIIKEGAFIGANSVVIPKVTIGKWATVGAGSVVLENVPDYATVVGNPARVISKKSKTKEYHLFVKKLKSLDEINSYKKLLNQHWGNNVYYTYEYLKYYENSTDKIRYFLLTEDGIPTAIMPFYIRKIKDSEHYKDIITPYGYGGPLCVDYNNSGLLIKFWELADQWYHKNNIVSEFVRFNLDGNHKEYTGELTETLVNIRGAIKESDEAQWTAFSTKVRNNYRKAEKHNLSFRLFEGLNITDDIITEFHDVYIETMERNKARDIYFFSKQYFESIIYSNPDNFAIAISYKENTAVSVELIIINATTLYAFLGGTRAQYFECRPNDFLRVEILKWAVTNKKKFYVLGGGQKNNDGLYKSKKVFFPKDEDVIFYTGRKIINTEIYNMLSESVPTTEESEATYDYFPAYRKL